LETHAGEFLLSQHGDLAAVDGHAATGGLEDAPHDGKQRGLAAPRGPHEKHHFAGVNIEVHAAQGGNGGGHFSEGFCQASNANRGLH